MSVSISVFLVRRYLPDGDWLEKGVAAMAPGFSFKEGFDPEKDSGWCPCEIKGEECGFEWELGEVESLPDAIDPAEADAEVLVSYRSSSLDAICATLVAATLTNITTGVLVTPDGELMDNQDALAWATEQVALFKKKGKK